MTASMSVPSSDHDRFERPALFWYAVIDGGLGLLAALSLSQKAYDTVSSKIPVPPRPVVQAVWVGSFFVHMAEATSAYRLAKGRGMPKSASRYAAEAMILGFPVLLKIRKVSGS